MNNKILFALLMALPMVFTSCLKDQEDAFDSSASERLEQRLQEVKSILVAAEEGWLMDYYVGENYEYGGYAYFVKFDSMTVTASSEIHEGECTSFWKMTSDNGPVLSFDTYNDILHDLATPNQMMPEGYEADFEFTVISATADLVTLKGKRTNNICYLRPFKGDKEAYVVALKKVMEDMIVSLMEATVDGDTINGTVNLDDRCIDFVVNNKGKETSMKTSFVYTDQGIRLCLPLTAGSKTLQDFSFDRATSEFSAREQLNEGVKIQGKTPQGYVKFEDFEGSYYFVFKLEDANKELVEYGIPVELTMDEENNSYLMDGLNDKFDVTLKYNKSKGALMMTTQYVGKYSGYNVYFQALNFEDGGVPADPNYGMITEIDTTYTDGVSYNWVNIPNEYVEIDMFCLFQMDAGGNQIGFLTSAADWYFTGGLPYLPNVCALRKR